MNEYIHTTKYLASATDRTAGRSFSLLGALRNNFDKDTHTPVAVEQIDKTRHYEACFLTMVAGRAPYGSNKTEKNRTVSFGRERLRNREIVVWPTPLAAAAAVTVVNGVGLVLVLSLDMIFRRLTSAKNKVRVRVVLAVASHCSLIRFLQNKTRPTNSPHFVITDPSMLPGDLKKAVPILLT